MGNLFYFDIVLLVDLAVKAPKKACLKVKLMKNSVFRKALTWSTKFLVPQGTCLCVYVSVSIFLVNISMMSDLFA